MPGPSNLYGVSNPVFVAQFFGAAGDVACTHDVWTTVINAGPFVAASSGYFFPVIFANVVLANGATAVTSFNTALAINNGSVVNSQGYDYRIFAANVEYSLFCVYPGVPSNTAWTGAGSTIQLQVYPYTNNCTIRQVGTNMTVMLFRAPDQ